SEIGTEKSFGSLVARPSRRSLSSDCIFANVASTQFAASNASAFERWPPQPLARQRSSRSPFGRIPAPTKSATVGRQLNQLIIMSSPEAGTKITAMGTPYGRAYAAGLLATDAQHGRPPVSLGGGAPSQPSIARVIPRPWLRSR